MCLVTPAAEEASNGRRVGPFVNSTVGVRRHRCDGARRNPRSGATLELTQVWSASILSTLKEQAETFTTILRSVEASMVAMEEAVKSQAQATQALAESLAASRQILESAMGAQTQAAERVETFVTGMLQVLTGQLEALRSQLQLSRRQSSSPLRRSETSGCR